jgi:hypothetical protein
MGNVGQVMATVAEASDGFAGFLGAALAPVVRRPLLLPILLLGILLTASNIIVLLNVPVKGHMPPVGFLLAALLRVAGLLLGSVAILRLLNASARAPWLPDGGFWLYVLSFFFLVALTALPGLALGVRPSAASGILINTGVALLTAPLIPWFTAMAVERPLAWRPSQWLRAWSRWLAPYLVWILLVAAPVGALHGVIDLRLVNGAGRWFWPLALIDGPLSLLLAVLGLALASEAYRRVARS